MRPIDREKQRLVKRALEHREFAIPDLPFYQQWSLQYLDDNDLNGMCELFMDFEIPSIWLHPEDLEKSREEMFAFLDGVLSLYLVQCKGFPEAEVAGFLDRVRLRPNREAP